MPYVWQLHCWPREKASETPSEENLKLPPNGIILVPLVFEQAQWLVDWKSIMQAREVDLPDDLGTATFEVSPLQDWLPCFTMYFLSCADDSQGTSSFLRYFRADFSGIVALVMIEKAHSAY